MEGEGLGVDVKWFYRFIKKRVGFHFCSIGFVGCLPQI